MRNPRAPRDGLLHDQHDRVARDLRVSLTDRCNLRCAYCMPPEGLEWMPYDQTLSDDEVIRLCTIAVTKLGIRKIRFTGGEPLLRHGLEQIIRSCSALKTDHGKPPETALTTNGLGLAHRAQALADAGLQRVNISLDTLVAEHFAQITRRDRLPHVIDALDAAASAGLTPIKINAVIMRGINEDDASDLLDFCLDKGIQLRFIEQMPIGPANTWRRDQLVTREDILQLLSERHELSPAPAKDPHAPARLWIVDGNPDHTVGVIASVSEPFCSACDRTRLTADGQIRSCLFSTSETDLRTPLRSGASDDEIADLWRDAMWSKPTAHGLDDAHFAVPSRTMSRIGG